MIDPVDDHITVMIFSSSSAPYHTLYLLFLFSQSLRFHLSFVHIVATSATRTLDTLCLCLLTSLYPSLS